MSVCLCPLTLKMAKYEFHKNPSTLTAWVPNSPKSFGEKKLVSLLLRLWPLPFLPLPQLLVLVSVHRHIINNCSFNYILDYKYSHKGQFCYNIFNIYFFHVRPILRVCLSVRPSLFWFCIKTKLQFQSAFPIWINKIAILFRFFKLHLRGRSFD